jgi:hypothetical protein
MFPGYALNYYEQSYQPPQSHNDTLNLSIWSSEKINIFANIDDPLEEPFFEDFSMIMP